jgi:hypothetical protein
MQLPSFPLAYLENDKPNLSPQICITPRVLYNGSADNTQKQIFASSFLFNMDEIFPFQSAH